LNINIDHWAFFYEWIVHNVLNIYQIPAIMSIQIKQDLLWRYILKKQIKQDLLWRYILKKEIKPRSEKETLTFTSKYAKFNSASLYGGINQS
jgi:hypothetical protein